jgi:acyl-CoA thioesterase-2
MMDPDAPTPEELVERLRTLLDIETIDADLYRGPRLPGGKGRVFGGQVIAQALVAAMRSVDGGRVAHSLHAYFMRPGDEQLPIVYRVVRDFEGRSFATRRIIAMQKGEPILNMAASFQTPEEGLAHQVAMPDAPDPETLIADRDLMERDRAHIPAEFVRFLLRPRPIEIRSIDARSILQPEKRPPHAMGWFRAVAPLGDDPDLHRAVLAYASDMMLLGTSMLPHGVSILRDRMQNASLDHAVWLHEPFRVDEWLLYVTDSPWSGHARGFNRGQIFSRDGRLVASIAQEGLIRLRERHSPA